MRIAILSDIHSNLPALEAVLEETERLHIKHVLCLGDIVGYGPFPEETIALVKARCEVCVAGNHDRGLLGEVAESHFPRFGAEAIRWSRLRISQGSVDYLSKLSLTSKFERSTLVHASPLKPELWTYLSNHRLAKENFGAFDTQLCFIGHTHIPLIVGDDDSINKYRPGGRFIINVGSVGQPRDGNSKAAFGIYDSATEMYFLSRVTYDIERTIAAIKEARLPEFLGQRLRQGI